jgi:hypothetical protein
LTAPEIDRTASPNFSVLNFVLLDFDTCVMGAAAPLDEAMCR